MGRKKVTVAEEGGTTTITGTPEDIIDAMQAASDNLKAAKKAIEIKGASLKDGMFGNYSYIHNLGNNTSNKMGVESEVPVHEDYYNAFRALDVHLALICEEVEPRGFSIEELKATKKTADKIEKFSVKSFSLEGNEDDPKVVLRGTKQLKNGALLKLETPKTKLDRSYSFSHELSEALDICVLETEEYMNGKRAPEQQIEMDFEAGVDDDDFKTAAEEE